jgi:TM2 domain-containing membrane protein YozV
MNPSNDRIDKRPAPADKKPVSSHRAFVYGACAPGLGEIYAGSRMRGILTASVFLICAGWFTLTLFTILTAVVGRVFDNLNGMATIELPDLPFISLGISFFGLYFLWLWAMISAVDVAGSHHQRTAAQNQASVMWAVTLSWFCPGAGQVYAADRRFGYILFAAYLIAILLSVPAYMQLYQSLSEITKSGQLSANNPYAIIDIVHGLIAGMNYSFGKLLQICVRYFALAATLAALRQGPLATDTRWSAPSAAYGAALLGMGWLCPGSGQILQRRLKIGWYFLAGYLSSKLLIGFLLGHNFIAVQTADSLAWITVLIQWVAMFEAPIWMMKANSKIP